MHALWKQTTSSATPAATAVAHRATRAPAATALTGQPARTRGCVGGCPSVIRANRTGAGQLGSGDNVDTIGSIATGSGRIAGYSTEASDAVIAGGIRRNRVSAVLAVAVRCTSRAPGAGAPGRARADLLSARGVHVAAEVHLLDAGEGVGLHQAGFMDGLGEVRLERADAGRGLLVEHPGAGAFQVFFQYLPPVIGIAFASVRQCIIGKPIVIIGIKMRKAQPIRQGFSQGSDTGTRCAEYVNARDQSSG